MATGDKKPLVMGEPIGVEGGPAPNTHAAQHAAEGADPITPDMIGAVNKAGDTMTGQITFTGTAFGAIRKERSVSGVDYSMNVGIGVVQSRGVASIQLFDSDSNVLGRINVDEDGPSYQNAGLAKLYSILHTGNKPSGSYTGNGDATARTIETGGIGNVLVLYSSYGVVIVTAIGAYKLGATYSGYDADTTFVNGALTMATTDAFINASGVTYKYLVP